jgi:hypothetical protein
MTISVLDRKMLWGRSGMKCAMCQIALSEEHQLGGAVIIGQEAHIVAKSPKGPRGNSPLSAEERDRYSNLVLLCPSDHVRIDARPEDYSVEMLLEIKAQHEKRVMASDAFDSQEQLADENWARLIDQLNSLIRWETWQSDVSPFFNPNSPWVRKEFTDRLGRVNEWIYGRVWPEGHNKLRSAIEAFGQLIAEWMHKFGEHAESPSLDSPVAMTEPFYKISDWDPDRYDRLLKEYEYHVGLLQDLVLEATRYGNYIAKLIRDEIDPSFRFDEGLLLLLVSGELFQTYLIKTEFRPSDFANGEPYKGLQQFEQERINRDVTMKESDA